MGQVLRAFGMSEPAHEGPLCQADECSHPSCLAIVESIGELLWIVDEHDQTLGYSEWVLVGDEWQLRDIYT